MLLVFIVHHDTKVRPPDLSGSCLNPYRTDHVSLAESIEFPAVGHSFVERVLTLTLEVL